MKWKLLALSIAVIAILSAGAWVYFRNNSVNDSFNIDSVFMKTVIKSSSNYTGSLNIKNEKDYAREFTISFKGIDGMAYAEEYKFTVGALESKNVRIIFSNPRNFSAGVYTGTLNVLSDESSKSLPIILEIESDDVLFDGNVAVYPASNIVPGETINAELKIFDLSKVGAASVETEYFVKNFNGENVLSEKETVVVSDKVSLTKPIAIPSSLKMGDYVFGAVVKYKDSAGTSSAFFRVDGKKSETNREVLYLVVMGGFMVLVVLIFIFYSIYSRDKLVEELNSQYRKELRRQYSFIEKKEREIGTRLRTRKEKKVARRIFKEVKKKRKRILEKEKEKRKVILKKLKKKNNKDEISRQVKEWKKRGYDTSVLEKGAKIPTINDIKKEIEKLGKKGYNVDMLK